ncbi:sigma-70 family RNA polymerase sigma factor [Rathayibacter sp. VKM Ac-2754]|uniref:sigma-70 family RNA polymerase sigma factor n=1 Tax=Rathayibacter sp. VKM Ac-2754 TaxID=2609251 RepID=UPI0013596497|nr:sigma-70 family RNA polymerase sigma factor [Rathayibacter sp. VKM Ac-2754]MWV60575.1 sigma-70 family RNA polymerase sigma factor [Rathayibacter sp. VKM Ac-2754]
MSLTDLAAERRLDARPAALSESAREEKDARTLSLFRRAAAVEQAEADRIRERIVLDHLGLAEAMARRISRGSGQTSGSQAGGDWSDLRQVAYVGLVKASQRFTPDRGDSFAAFAVPTITGELKRHLRDLGWMIRPPRTVQELHRRTNAVAEELAQELGRHPSDDEVARRLGVEVSEVTDARSAGHPLSLDETVGEAGVRLAETLGGDDERLSAIERRHGLAEALGLLEEGQQELLRMRFVDEMTQQQIADELGTTQMQVSRLQRRTLAQLAETLGAPERERRARVTPVRSTETLRTA